MHKSMGNKIQWTGVHITLLPNMTFSFGLAYDLNVVIVLSKSVCDVYKVIVYDVYKVELIVPYLLYNG